MDTSTPTATLEIFRAGTHVTEDGRTLTFSAGDVAAIADSYDPALYESPLVVGHPKTDDPAYGWTKALRADGGVLYAEPHQVDPQFAEMVNAGRMKKISASIYLPESPGNPKPGTLYLRHIGFLGAQAPGVKGLRPAQFSEDDGAVSFSQPMSRFGWMMGDLFQRFRDWLIDSNGLEAADRIIPRWQIRDIETIANETANSSGGSAGFSQPKNFDPKRQLAAGRSRSGGFTDYVARAADYAARTHTQQEHSVTQPDTTALDARQQQLDEKDAALAKREAEIKRQEAEATQRRDAERRDEAAAFAEGLFTAGKLLPTEKTAVVELLMALPAGTTLNFSEGGQQITKPAGATLRELLNRLPERVNYAEKSGQANAPATANFAAPPGAVVDASRADLYTRAKQYQAQHPNTAWVDAVAACGG